MTEKAYQLVVRKGPRTGQIFSLTEDSISLGRDPSSDIVINDAEVSRQHARLTLQEGGYTLQDIGSTNGTFVVGNRLAGEPHKLEPGQVIMFGTNVTLVYQMTTDVDPMATVIAPAAMLPVDAAAESDAGVAAKPAFAFEPEDELEVDDIIFEEPEEALESDLPVLEEVDFDDALVVASAGHPEAEEQVVEKMELEEISLDEATAAEDEVDLLVEDVDVIFEEPLEELAEPQPAAEDVEIETIEDEAGFATMLEVSTEEPIEELVEEDPVVREISFDDLIFEEPDIDDPQAAEADLEEPIYEELTFDEPAEEEPVSEEAAQEEADFFDAIDEMEEPEDLATVLEAPEAPPVTEPEMDEAAEPDPSPFPSFEPAEQEPAPEAEPAPFPSFEPAEPEPEALYEEPEQEHAPEPEPQALYEEPEPIAKFDSVEPLLDETPKEPAEVAALASEPEEEKKKSGIDRRLIIGLVAVLLLCCCLIIAATIGAVATGAI